MKAVVYHSYGSPEVLQLTNLPMPLVGDDSILVQVINTSVTAGDWRLRKADPFLARIFNGLFRPRRIKILGFELSGIITETGKNVTKFQVGEAVMAHCGLQFGAYAEYRIFKESDLLVRKPETITFEEAATAPVGGTTALKLMEKINSPKGSSILIYGASGSVGSACVQLAHHYGYQVTAVCSQQNSEWVLKSGADHVIDYTSQSVSDWGNKYDVVIDAVGKYKTADLRKFLRPGGKIASVRSQYKIKKEDMLQLSELLEKGIFKPVLDRIYPLESIREAHDYVESKRKKGNVVIRI